MDTNNNAAPLEIDVKTAVEVLREKILNSSSPLLLPYTIGKATVATYNELLAIEDRPKCKIQYKNGEIRIIELTSLAHERAKGEIEDQMFLAIGRSGALIKNGSPTYNTSPHMMMPDGSWKRRGRKSTSSTSDDETSFNGVASPQNNLVLILEVGYSQTLDDLREKANKWFSKTSAREVILIDIKGTANRPTLRGEIWQIGKVNPVQNVDFSDVTTAGTHFLHVSLVNLFISELNIPVDLKRRCPENVISIDLHYVKNAIFAY